MEEFKYAQPPEIVVATLMRDQPIFLRGLGHALDLSVDDTAALLDVDPRIWVDWSLATLSGEEMKPVLPVDEQADLFVPPRVRGLMGGIVEMDGQQYLAYQEGELARRTDQLYADGTEAAREKLGLTSALCARFMMTMMMLIGPNSDYWQKTVPQLPQTVLTPNKTTGQVEVIFPANGVRHPVEGPVSTVITHGPGLTGGNFAGALCGLTKDVHFVSGGKGAQFVAFWIRNILTEIDQSIEAVRREGTLHMTPMLPKGVPLDKIRAPRPEFYTRGMAAASKIIEAEVGASGVDIVVMSAAQIAGPADCLAATESAQRVLRPGGLFVYKGPDVSLPGEAGLDIVGVRAAQLLGRPVLAGECGTQSQYIDPSLPERRPASFAIYQK